MKRCLAVGTVAALVMMLANRGSAADGHGRLHDELGHREFHRQLYHRQSHRYPMSWSQHQQLHDNLDHQQFHDQLAHRQYHRDVWRWSYPVQPDLRYGYTPGYVPPRYIHPRSGYYTSGRPVIGFSGRNFGFYISP